MYTHIPSPPTHPLLDPSLCLSLSLTLSLSRHGGTYVHLLSPSLPPPSSPPLSLFLYPSCPGQVELHHSLHAAAIAEETERLTLAYVPVIKSLSGTA